MKPNKIYINATFLCSDNLTGIARFAIELSAGLKKHLGASVVLVAPPNVGHHDIVQALGVIKVGVSTNRVIWEQVDLPLFLMQCGNPLLVSLGNTAPLFYRNQIISVLDIFYQRADSILKEKNEYSRFVSHFFKLTTPLIIKSAKKVITISQYSKDDIVNYFKTNPNKITIIHPSLSNKFINLPASQPTNQYGRYILGVSAITPRKNFDGLIRAYVEAGFNDTNLVIVGGVEMSLQSHTLHKLYDKNPRIIFTGHVSDAELIALYQNALFFAYPSFLEGFGIPPLEAMACGCPTLVSNVTSLPEVCGDASIYVDPYSILSISEGMLKLANDAVLRQGLIIKGYERVNLYSPSEATARLIDLVKEYS